jgi:hypothetical protein
MFLGIFLYCLGTVVSFIFHDSFNTVIAGVVAALAGVILLISCLPREGS